ncbi:MAG: sigma-70 family RNA polymerase sigma factor [Oscillospiraceae bacterium]|nr:sigma-70 family RNA polymerase sigma factor [Oscillospiraceae bacterium]
MEFEDLLCRHRAALERFVRFRIPVPADAEDIIQDTCAKAFERFGQLKDPLSFKGWLLSIARNRCNDYFRTRAKCMEIPLDTITPAVGFSRRGPDRYPMVSDVMERLGSCDKQILYLFYWLQLPQGEIAKRLNIPLGTVKSRLHTARANFKQLYPKPSQQAKGDSDMKLLPEYLPRYTITPSEQPPFSPCWEELQGWFLVPRLGERISWAMYDDPSGKKTWQYDLKVLGEAEIHGIRGVEIEAVPRGTDPTGSSNPSDNIYPTHFVAQLTDTHCRYLACTAVQSGVKRLITFLDGDEFLENWGFGPDNCGNETHPLPRGLIVKNGSVITCDPALGLLDVVGRYEVCIGGKRYDTVCIVDAECYNEGTLSEQYIDESGRTVLWRRFNRDDWAMERYGKHWSEQLPDNETLTVNGVTYVHWYDCVTDHIL